MTVCNADFSFQFTAATTVKFTPVALGDSFNTVHYWRFGDGSVVSIPIATHTYAANGAYNVTHIVLRKSPNGIIVCADSVVKQITIQQGTNACNLQAYFSWNIDSLNWNTVRFQNQSQPAEASDSIRWNFGDGTIINGVVGTLGTPNHVYANAGTYNVCIRVKKNNITTTSPCVSELCKTVVVQAACNLQAYFSWNIDSLNWNNVHFQNQSQPAEASDSIRWNFGDGTIINGVVGTLGTPNHVYANAGTYNVCIRVKKNNAATVSGCVSEFCKTVIVSQPCTLKADYSWSATTTNPSVINFHNLSTPLSSTDSIRWTFGDGTTSLDVNPTHTFAQPGIYTVCLRVKKNNNASGTGPCVSEICKTVVVQSACNIQIGFTMRADSVNTHKIYFTNTTITPTAASTAVWHFGDGATATTWNAVHEYAQAGTYRVCLNVTAGPNCTKEICDTIVVRNPPPSCTEISLFSFEKFSNDSQKFKFTPNFIGTDVNYTWTFGDATGSHDVIATHRYAAAGVYTACLTAWRSAACATTTCKEIRVLPQINCDSIHVGYTYQKDPIVVNKLYFYANANWTILDQTWTITKIAPATTTPVILHQNNPVYVFTDTGYYNVCLKAITSGGCVKEYCSVIHIEHVSSNVCELQAYPNPTNDIVNVNVSLTQAGPIDAYVYNSLNVQVKDKHIQGVVGNNVVSISLSGLTAGIYTIKVLYGGRYCYAKFTKL
ncbi:MAG: PKD domain-containing protein [Ferruginibacter sp.]